MAAGTPAGTVVGTVVGSNPAVVAVGHNLMECKFILLLHKMTCIDIIYLGNYI